MSATCLIFVALACLLPSSRAIAAQATRTGPPCTAECDIAGGEAYDLSAMLGSDWKASEPMQIVLMFDLSAGRTFRIDYGDNMYVAFGSKHARLIAGDTPRIQTMLRYRPEARYVALSLNLALDKRVEVQLAQGDAAMRLVDASPIVSLPWPKTSGDILSIQKMDVPQDRGVALRLTKFVFRQSASATPHTRRSRGANCDAGPALFTVINRIFQLCENSPITLETPATRAGEPVFRLTHVISHDQNPMAVMAAAGVCGVPPDGVPASRTRRDTVPSLACLSRATLIVTLYQILFPEQWNLEHFTRIIDHILAHGSVGASVANTNDANTLVSVVQQQTSATDTRRADALEAYHHATAALAPPLVVSPLPSAAPCTTAGSSGMATADLPGRNAAIGRYELYLAAFTPTAVLPRVRQQNALITSTTPFEFTVVDTDDMAQLREIITFTGAWMAEYDRLDALHKRRCSMNPRDPVSAYVRFAAPSIAHNIFEDAHGGTSDGTVFIVVRFGGRPVSILEGQLQGDGTASIVYSLSAPENVFDPLHEGAIRGAGNFALQQFLTYAKARGIRTVTSDVITEPSALLKQKAGFRHFSEL